MTLTILWPSVVCCVVAAPAWLAAQSEQARATSGPVRLEALHRAALEADPRYGELQLLRARAELRIETIDAERLPAIGADMHAQYQSDVPIPPPFVPGGRPLFVPLNDSYDASIRIDQAIFDPTRGPRLAVERTQLLEAEARLTAALFGLRQEVNDAFFTAALLQERAETLSAQIANLESRLRDTAARVREGAALAAESAAIEATLLERRQDEQELRVNRAASFARLSNLTGRTFADTDRLDVPDVRAAVAEARRTAAGSRSRPEYEQFARTRERLSSQAEVQAAGERPRVSAFARVGYARPGPNFIGEVWDTYLFAGVQLHWKVWTWGAADRDRRVFDLDRQILAADEASFTKALVRSNDDQLATIDRLEQALALDDRIVALREDIERTTGVRFREGVVPAAEYLDRSSELVQARFARATHRVELAQAGARYLTTLGLEVR